MSSALLAHISAPARLVAGSRRRHVLRSSVTRKPMAVRANSDPHGKAAAEAARTKMSVEVTIRNAVLAAAMASMMVSSPASAQAPMPTSQFGSETQRQAELLQQIIRDRTGGVGLPTLNSSPGALESRARAQAMHSLAVSELREAPGRGELARLAKEVEEAQRALREQQAQNAKLQSAEAEARAAVQRERSRVAELERLEAALTAKGSMEAQRIQQLQEALRQQPKQVIKEVLVEVPKAAQSSVKEASKLSEPVRETESVSEAEPKGLLGALNGLGFVIGGGLLGFVGFNKGETEKAEAALNDKLKMEQDVVAKLKAAAAEAQETIQRERVLIAQLKQEQSGFADRSAKLLTLEKEEVGAAKRAADLAQRALEAEKKLVETMKIEAAATAEAMEAERAARYATQAEMDALALLLKQTEEAMATERQLAAKIGKEAQRAMRQRDGLKTLQGSMVVDSVALRAQLEQASAERLSTSEQLESTSEELEAAQAQVAALEQELATAKDNAQQQAELLQRVGKEHQSVREAMSSLKCQAGEWAVRLAQQQESAAEACRKAAEDLAGVNALLQNERDALTAVREEASNTRQQLDASTVEVARLCVELAEVQAEAEGLRAQVRDLQAQVQATEQLLFSERHASKEAREHGAGLAQELAEVAAKLKATAEMLEQERAEKSSLVVSLEETRGSLKAMRVAFEEEKNRVASLQAAEQHLGTELAAAEGRSAQLVSERDALEAKLNQMERALIERLHAAEDETAQISAALSASQARSTDLAAARGALAEELQEVKSTLTARLHSAESQVADMQNLNAALRAEFTARESELQDRLAMLESEASMAQRELVGAMAARDEAMNRFSELDEQIRLMQRDADEVRQQADMARVQLENEQSAREAAEEIIARQRIQLDELSARERDAQAEVAKKLVQAQSELDTVKSRLATRITNGTSNGAPGNTARRSNKNRNRNGNGVPPTAPPSGAPTGSKVMPSIPVSASSQTNAGNN